MYVCIRGMYIPINQLVNHSRRQEEITAQCWGVLGALTEHPKARTAEQSRQLYLVLVVDGGKLVGCSSSQSVAVARVGLSSSSSRSSSSE